MRTYDEFKYLFFKYFWIKGVQRNIPIINSNNFLLTHISMNDVQNEPLRLILSFIIIISLLSLVGWYWVPRYLFKSLGIY
jgi:hypothetical protein